MKSAAETILTRGVVEVIERDHLKKALVSGEKLRVKFGVDPTSPVLHLGHAVPLRKLREFQDAGHTAVLIIGDFTARIGDPSGQSAERKPLSEKEVKDNMKQYLKQAGKILNLKNIEIHYNSKWFLKEGVAPILELARAGSIQQVLHRADFKKRLDQGQDITLLETMYPLFQGYDSVKVKADAEIGGTDQKFNLLMGRRIQRHFGMPEQDIVTTPILEGTDGVKKMSKSYGNYIGINEKPEEMFGKIMSIQDSLIAKYFELLTDFPAEKIKTQIQNSPRDAKLKLAEILVAMYHGKLAAQKAEKEFIKVVSQKQTPTEIKTIKLKNKNINITDLIVDTKLAASKGEARRLIQQKGVKIDGEIQSDFNKTIILGKPILLQVGKRKFLRVCA